MAQRLSVLVLAALLGGAGSASAQTEAEPVEPTEPESPGATDEPAASEEPPAQGSAGAGEPVTEDAPGGVAPAARETSPGATSGATTPAPSTPPRTTTAARSTSGRTTPPLHTSTGDESEQEEEDEEDEEDWGAFYIQLLGGYSYANVISFSQENFLPEAERVEGSGFFGGAGLGFRVLILTIGAQASLASYAPTEDDGFELGTVIGTIGLHLPIPHIQPYFRVGAGYAWMGKANFADPGISETRVYGFVIEGGFGVDIKLGRAVSLGLGVDAAYLNLGRQSASEVGMIDDVNFEEDGDAVGYQVRGHVHLTFHI